MNNLYQLVPVGIVIFAITGASALANAEPIPEIIVTADFRQHTTMETPGSVTVVTGEAIKSRAAQHFEDIILSIPNVNYAGGTNRARFFQIRGIGERSQFVDPVNPSVGVLIDDVDFSGAGTIATLMDVRQVEVLRGPQGTRYGANALAGLINIATNNPVDEFELALKLSLATYNSRTFGLMLNNPLTENLQGRLVIESHKSDGYIENDFHRSDDTNGRDEFTLRGKLAWQLQDNWHLGMTLARVKVDNGYDAFSLDNTRHTLSDEPGFDTQDSRYLSLKSQWQFNTLVLEALLNRADSDIDYGYDEDWTYTGFHVDGYTATDAYLRERETTSAEFRLVSTEEASWFGGTTDWVVGLYLLLSDESLHRSYTYLPGDFFSDNDFDTRAVFAQLDTRLTDTLILHTGLRFEQREAAYKDSLGVAFSPDDNLWGGRVALEYLISDNTMTYASIARGYKAGGFNTDGSLDADLRTFDEEYLIEYEAGIKMLLASGRVQLQVAAFYDARHDQQIKNTIARQRDDKSTGFIDYNDNAARGTNKGIELDISYQLSDAFRVTGNLGWLRARFDQFSYATKNGVVDLGGRDQAHAPRYMYSLSLQYERGPWFASLTTDGKDAFYFSDRHSVKSDRYGLYHASVGHAADWGKVTLWARNLTDEDYTIRAFGSFGNNPRKEYVTEPYFQYGEPRIVGVTAEFDF